MIVRCRVCHRVQPLDGYKTCPGCLERNAVRLRRHRERRAAAVATLACPQPHATASPPPHARESAERRTAQARGRQ